MTDVPDSELPRLHGAQGTQIATERAVDAAIGAYLNPPRPKRR